MIYQDLYWNAAIIYLLAVIGFYVVVWKIGTKLPWRPLSWWLSWLYVCVVLTPWRGNEPEEYYAPAIIVAAFDFLDVGWRAALTVLTPMLTLLVLGSTVIVAVAVVQRVIALRKTSPSSSAGS